MLAHPEQLGRRESGHGQVARHPTQRGPRAFKRGALLTAAPIVPENTRPQHSAGGIKQRRAVHLTRQSDCTARGQLCRMAAFQRVTARLRRLPPRVGVLLTPPIVRTLHGEWMAGGANHALVPTRCMFDEHQLHARRAEIDTEGDHASSRNVRCVNRRASA